MNTAEKALLIIISTISILAILAFAQWSGERDAKIMESSGLYEKCVLEEYRTTPADYYNEHGNYPQCG